MKRYIKSSSSIDDVIQKVQSRLEQSGVIDSVYSVDGYENYSGNYYIEVTLKPHRKKIKKTLIANKLDAYIDKLCDSVQSWIEEGETIPRDNAYVVLVSIKGLALGYISGISRGRGQIWAGLTSNPDTAERYNKPYANMVNFIDELTIPRYVSTDYRSLHLVSDGDIDDLKNWVNKNRGETYHAYTLSKWVSYSYVNLNDASSIPSISESKFESILVR